MEMREGGLDYYKKNNSISGAIKLKTTAKKPGGHSPAKLVLRSKRLRAYAKGGSGTKDTELGKMTSTEIGKITNSHDFIRGDWARKKQGQRTRRSDLRSLFKRTTLGSGGALHSTVETSPEKGGHSIKQTVGTLEMWGLPKFGDI